MRKTERANLGHQTKLSFEIGGYMQNPKLDERLLLVIKLIGNLNEDAWSPSSVKVSTSVSSSSQALALLKFPW